MDGRTDGWTHRKNNAALAHLYHVGKWCNKFGRILTSGFGGDSATDGQMGGAVTISPSIFSSPELLWAIVITLQSLSVCLSGLTFRVRPMEIYSGTVAPKPTSVAPLNDFSSKTPRTNFFKLHVEPCIKGGLKICKKRSWSVNQCARHADI